jgi:hypothetical protein
MWIVSAIVEDGGVLVHDTGCSVTSVGIHVVKEQNCPQTLRTGMPTPSQHLNR